MESQALREMMGLGVGGIFTYIKECVIQMANKLYKILWKIYLFITFEVNNCQIDINVYYL